MNGANDPAAWLRKAGSDALTIQRCVAEGPTPWDTVCFHAQQATEKILKAYLVACGRVPRKTHDLASLLGECVEEGAAVADLLDNCQLLLRYAASALYPGEPFEPGHGEGVKVIKAMDRVRSRLLPLIREVG